MTSPFTIARAGLVLTATGVLSVATVRGYLEESAATARDLSIGFAAFLILCLLASARVPPAWSGPFALAVTASSYLWGATLFGSRGLGLLLLIAAAVIAYLLAQPQYRLLVVAGFALWTPGLYLFAGTIRILAPPIVVAAALASFAMLLATVLVRRGSDDLRLRRIGLALLAVAVVSAVFERHNVVASLALAPDDVMALLAVVVLAALLVARLPTRLVGAIASGTALATYALVAIALVLGKPYHVDAVTSPHYAAELLLQGKNPYVAFDMTSSLARFGLPPTIATKLEDGSYLQSHNYPAGGFLLVAPFVWAGVPDMRWVYLVEMLLIALLFIGHARVPWRPLVASLLVGNIVLTRQYVLAGIDPTWALGLAAAWLFVERRWLSPIALGLACASRQPAWFFVPFYLLATWRQDGAREAARRAAVLAATFAIPNLPFFLDSPQAWISSVLAPIVAPLEPYGVGIVRLGLLGPLPLFPRAVYTAIGVGVLLLLLALLWRNWRRLPNAALTFPLVPLYFTWRSLQNYFVFLPLLAILRDEDLLKRTTRRVARGHAVVVGAGTAPSSESSAP